MTVPKQPPNIRANIKALADYIENHTSLMKARYTDGNFVDWLCEMVGPTHEPLHTFLGLTRPEAHRLSEQWPDRYKFNMCDVTANETEVRAWQVAVLRTLHETGKLDLRDMKEREPVSA